MNEQAYDIDVEIDDDVFNPVYLPYLDCMARTQIFYGGSGSGKSVFVAQRCVLDLLAGGRNYLICRAVGNTIKKSVFTEIKKVIEAWGLQDLFKINKSEGVITCVNGYQAIFFGLDDVAKVKSVTPAKGVITDIWVEEATETDKRTIKDLYKRQRGGDPSVPKRMTLTFNPIVQNHWIYLQYFSPLAWADDQTSYSSSALAIQKTWYVHNSFLTAEDVADLEGEEDKYFRDVYTYGNWGVLGNVIFTNWTVADLLDPNDKYYLPPDLRTNHRDGLDFGFSQDPAALWVDHYDKSRKIIYVYDEFYEKGLTNDQLAREVKKRVGRRQVTADSSEPKSIQELRERGINIRGARKGPDSVLYGIQWMQQHLIVIDKRCINTKNEIMQYKWKEDKNGVALRVPVDRFNNLIDAGRYGHEQDMSGVKLGGVKAKIANRLSGEDQ